MLSGKANVFIGNGYLINIVDFFRGGVIYQNFVFGPTSAWMFFGESAEKIYIMVSA